MKNYIRIFLVSLALAFSTLCVSSESQPKVILETNMGQIVLELNSQAAPVTVKNFISYVEDRFYDGIIFHRVIENFMIQAGGHRFDLTPKNPSKSPIINESDNGLKNLRGTIAMARTGAPDSATSQFFINHKTNSFLDYQKNRPGYAVFGKVVKGMDVVDKIATTKTKKAGQLNDLPIDTISIIRARLAQPITTTKVISETEKSTSPAK